MIAKHPHVALYRAFLAKKYKEEKHGDFQEALKRAALYSPNRKRLYHYINVESQPVKSVQPIKDKPASEQPIEEHSVTTTSATIAEETPTIEPEENKETIEESTVSPASDKVEREAEVTEITPVQTIADEVAEVAMEVAEASEVEEETAAKQVKEDEHSFVEWLEFLDDEISFEADANELNEDIERQEAAAKYEIELNEEINKIKEEEPVTPDLSPEEHQAVNQLAQGSITLKTGLVTETLAKIMLMQGKINDAIAMYQALSLKYPEKSNYFAAQIEKIKNS